MTKQAISLFSISQEAQSSFVTIRKNPINAVRLNEIKPNKFKLFKFLNLALIDLTASNHPERFFCNTVYYIYEAFKSQIYISVLTPNHGNVLTASTINFCALVTERECSEMFGILFENHPDLRKLLLDYGATFTPLLKLFPLSGFTQIVYTVKKCLIFQAINLPQYLRVFQLHNPWINL